MRPARALAFTVIALTLAWAGNVLGTPSTISYQGKLTTSGGSPVADGNYAVTFTLWTDSVGGSLIWTELQDVQVTGGEGLFACQLGSLQPLGGALVIHADLDLYLQSSVAGEILLPRLALGAVPHAFSASSVHHVEPGVGSMEMSVGDDTTKIAVSHQGFSNLIDSYVHLTEDRGILGLKSYDPAVTYTVGDAVVVTPTDATHTLDHDADGDGIAEVSVWEKVDNTEAISMTAVDVDEDGVPDVGSSSSAKVSRSVLKTFFETGDIPTQSRVIDSVDETGAYVSTEATGPDGSSSSNMKVRINDLESKLQSIGLLSRSSITNTLTPTICGVAINQKGTGADKNRTIGGTCDDSSAVQVVEVDDDGDGNAESRANIAALLNGNVVIGSMHDSDDDGIPENEASMVVTPTTSSMAIKTKGTGADKNRTIGGTCDDSSAIQVIEVDDDGDGIAEARAAVSSVSSLSGGGGGAASSAYARMSHDSDDDGVPEKDAEMIVTPTTSSVAIKWKGTGADANRSITSSCDTGSVVHAMLLDDDGDSVPEQEIEQIMTPTTSSVAIKTKGTGADPNRVVSQTSGQDAAMEVGTASKNIGIYVNEVSGQSTFTMTDNTLGTVDTAIIIDAATKRFGIGVAQPANPIEHSSGAKLTAGGVWTNASDANAKENFQPIDGEEILEQIDALEITRWNYKADKASEHIGPTAQDFKQTFGVGSDGTSISTIDPSGIALAAIKELNKQNRSLLEASSDLAAQNRVLLEQNALLKKQMEVLALKVERLAAAR